MSRGRVLRIAGRVLGGVAASWWVLVVVGSLVTGPDPYATDDATGEGIGVAVLALANAGAYVVALLRERIGSRLLVATGGLFCLFALATAGRNHPVAMLVSGGPFVLSGALLWLAEVRSGRRRA